MSLWHWVFIAAVVAVMGAPIGFIAVRFMGRQSFWTWFLYGFLAFPIAALHLGILGFRPSGSVASKMIGAALIAMILWTAYWML